MFDIIAIDWGSVRTGLAFGSSESGLVIPYNKELDTKDLKEVLTQEINKKSINTIILGLPTNFKLQDTTVTTSIRIFAKELEEYFPTIKLIFVNENNTSKAGKGLKNKHSINHIAAVEILNIYLNNL